MNKTNLIPLILSSVILVGCVAAPEKPQNKTSVSRAKVVKKVVKIVQPAEPIHLSIVAPSKSSGKQSKLISIYPLWKCEIRTNPPNQPLQAWINDEKDPKPFDLSNGPKSEHGVEFFRLGSYNDNNVLVNVDLFPPRN